MEIFFDFSFGVTVSDIHIEAQLIMIHDVQGLIRREAFSTKDFLYPRLESETSNNKLKDNPSIALHGT